MKDEKNRKVRHLGNKVNLIVVCLLAVSIFLVVRLCVAMFTSLAMDMLHDWCVNGTNMLAYELDDYQGPEDKTEMLDELKELMRCEFTIFRGDERAYTTIVKDGERAVGTKLSENLKVKILEQGESYVGTMEILGVEHLCSYVPTRDENGQIDGLIFCGISVETATQQIDETVRMATLVGCVLVVISVVIMSIFIIHSVSKPLSKLTNLAQTMERGELGLDSNKQMEVSIRSNDEIGHLGVIFKNMIHTLRGYIGEISTILAAISDGDLTAGTKQDYVGDFASIKKSLDDILTKLNSTMAQIVESTEYVSGGAEQVSVGAQALSQGAVEQASTVEALEMNMREISQNVTKSAENAEQASKYVELVGEQIMESNQKMQEMIDAMQEINDSSNEISKIIKTIESIASQTNILALNAAVEAARAGEAGKGFAVVAEEVRALASKSAEASKSTAKLIARSIEKVEHGTLIVNETASQLASVVAGASEVMETTNHIAETSRTQAQSIVDIQESISQISSVVQTNSATAQESAATSEELSAQANMLKNLTCMFRLKGSRK